MPRSIAGLPYWGGKCPHRPLAKWIASRIPWERDTCYVEPFAGMLGILLSRQRVNHEVVSDANGRVINWWRVIRDHPEEFGRRLDWTHQQHQAEFEQSLRDIDHPDPIRRAVAFTVVVAIGIHHTDSSATSDTLRVSIGIGERRIWESSDILALRERIKRVQLRTADACSILARMQGEPAAVIYCDPPYRTADDSKYQAQPDIERLTEALLAQQGRVAVSGYNDEWDHLGWRSESFPTSANVVVSGTNARLPRTEKLWMNYDPPQRGLF